MLSCTIGDGSKREENDLFFSCLCSRNYEHLFANNSMGLGDIFREKYSFVCGSGFELGKTLTERHFCFESRFSWLCAIEPFFTVRRARRKITKKGGKPLKESPTLGLEFSETACRLCLFPVF